METRTLRSAQWSALVLAAMILGGCGSFPGRPFEVRGAPPHHIVMIDTNGRLIDPTGNKDCRPDWRSRLAADIRDARIDDAPEFTVKELCAGKFDGWSSEPVDEPHLYFADMFRAIHAQQSKLHGRTRRVALIVHGGLATNLGNLENARDITAKMLKDPGAPYPIFINWQSNLWGNLFAHLVKVRQGDSKGFKHWFLAPAYLVGGLAKGVGRAPATWFYHYSNDLDRIRARYSHEMHTADTVYCELRKQYQDCIDGKTSCSGVIPISKGPFAHDTTEGARSTTRNASTNLVPIRAYASLLGSTPGGWWTWLPVKLLTAPLLDGLGSPAWDTMIRHVKLGFHNDGIPSEEPADLDEPLGGTFEPAEGHGGIARFMRALRTEVKNTSCANPKNDRATCLDWELTLIGHSMGTIMANEILYEFNDGPEFKTIVYMAAACSVREYEQTVVEYLKRHTGTQMYHLTLHDFAEIRDQYFLEIPPSGSLLVWIDNFLSNPATLRDRTAGRFTNLMIALPSTPLEVRDRVHVKTFGVGNKLRPTDPQHHGEFNNFTGPPLTEEERKRNKIARDETLKFWEKKFWEPEVKYRPTTKERCRYEPWADAMTAADQ